MMENIDPKLLNQSFDPQPTFCSYFWGTLGIAYYQDGQNSSEIRSDSSEEYRNDIMMYDGAREVKGIGLNTWGIAQ